MKYQLIHSQKSSPEGFDSIWDALKKAITLLEESECKIDGIQCGEDLFGKPIYVLKEAGINSIWFVLSNCPHGYWQEVS